MKAQRPPAQPFLPSLGRALSLLSRRERWTCAWIAALVAVSGLLDTLALLSVLPFINLIVDPGVAAGNRWMGAVHALLGEPDHSTFVLIAGAVGVTAIVLSSTVSVLSQALAGRFSAGCQERLGADLMNAILAAPYAWFLTRNAHSLARYFHNQLVIWGRDVIRRLFLLVSQIFLILLPAVMLVSFAPTIGSLALAGVVMFTAAMLAFVRARTRHYIAMKSAAEERSALIAAETVTGIKDIKLTSRERVFAGLFGHVYHLYVRANARANTWNLLPVAVAMMLGQLTLILIAYVFWRSGLSAAEIAAQLALVVLVTSRIVPASNQLSASMLSLWNMLPWTDALHALCRELTAFDGAAGAPRAEVRKPWRQVILECVSFDYGAGAPRSALADVTMTFDRGCSYALVGQSGAGKSTLVDVLLGLLEPSAGRVLVDGAPLADFGVRAWQAGIGYVPQAPFIADDTVRANVAFGVKPERINDAHVTKCLDMAHLHETIDGLPEGLSTRLGDRGMRLSGGQRQRIAIARALYDNPDLLVLDEATSALDVVSETEIRKTIESLSGRITTVVIAHRLATVRHCDAIILMAGGKVSAIGSWEELHRRSSLFRQLAASDESNLPPAAGGVR